MKYTKKRSMHNLTKTRIIILVPDKDTTQLQKGTTPNIQVPERKLQTHKAKPEK